MEKVSPGARFSDGKTPLDKRLGEDARGTTKEGEALGYFLRHVDTVFERLGLG